MGQVQWIDCAIASPPVASPASVAEAERLFRVRFPADFLAIATIRQGAAPVPAGIALGADGGTTAVSHLLHFEPEPGASNIIIRRFPVEGVLRKGYIPFAEDIGGDLFCFDHIEDYDNPPVIYWSVDTGPIRLASNFTAFLALLA